MVFNVANIDPATGKNKGGRPLGAVSKLAREAREEARKTGKLPHEILLDMAREHVAKVPDTIDQQTGEVTYKWVVRDDEFRKDAAKAAAPFYAPKLSSVETIAGMSDAELDEVIRRAAAEAGVGVGLAGEGAESEAEDGARGGAEPSPRARHRIG